jgi:putative tricarboxylic transport membrane protein
MRFVKVLCSLFWLFLALGICTEASRLRMGHLDAPGPGFFPLIIGVVTGLLSLLAFFQSFKTETKATADGPRKPLRWWNLVVIGLAVAGYAVTLEKIGFLINTFLLIVLLLKVVEPQSWRTAIAGGLVTALASELVFNVILRAQIPSGILGF